MFEKRNSILFHSGGTFNGNWFGHGLPGFIYNFQSGFVFLSKYFAFKSTPAEPCHWNWPTNYNDYERLFCISTLFPMRRHSNERNDSSALSAQHNALNRRHKFEWYWPINQFLAKKNPHSNLDMPNDHELCVPIIPIINQLKNGQKKFKKYYITNWVWHLVLLSRRQRVWTVDSTTNVSICDLVCALRAS